MPQILRPWLIPLAVVAVLATGWLMLRSQATTFESGASFESVMAGSEPVVLEFFGNT